MLAALFINRDQGESEEYPKPKPIVEDSTPPESRAPSPDIPMTVPIPAENLTPDATKPLGKAAVLFI